MVVDGGCTDEADVSLLLGVRSGCGLACDVLGGFGQAITKAATTARLRWYLCGGGILFVPMC